AQDDGDGFGHCLFDERGGAADVAAGYAAYGLEDGVSDGGDLLGTFDEERDRVVDGDDALDDRADGVEHRHQLGDGGFDQAGDYPVLDGADDHLLQIADPLDDHLPRAGQALGDERLDERHGILD